MKLFFINLWKFSKFRFYLLNTKWNLRFWLFSRKIYKSITYEEPIQDFISDYSNKLYAKTKTVTKKRFVGFLFENNIFLDNPGIQNIDNETWKAWKRKKLIR